MFIGQLFESKYGCVIYIYFSVYWMNHCFFKIFKPEPISFFVGLLISKNAFSWKRLFLHHKCLFIKFQKWALKNSVSISKEGELFCFQIIFSFKIIGESVYAKIIFFPYVNTLLSPTLLGFLSRITEGEDPENIQNIQSFMLDTYWGKGGTLVPPPLPSRYGLGYSELLNPFKSKAKCWIFLKIYSYLDSVGGNKQNNFKQ